MFTIRSVAMSSMRRFAMVFGVVLVCIVMVTMSSAKTLDKPVNFKQAEGRVSDLISKLDAVSNHAARANDEIQTTLRELWQIVDLLGRDRCGDVVERVRTLQRKATARVEKLEHQLSNRNEVEEQLRREISARTVERDAAQEKADASEKKVAEANEQIVALKDEVRKVKRTCVLDGSYKVVAERLTEVRDIGRTRMETLEKIVRLFEEERSSGSDSLTKLEGALEGLRAAASEGGETSGEASLRKELSIVSSQLRAVKMERDDMSNEISKLQRDLERVKASKGGAETVVFHDIGEGSSWVGSLALGAVSVVSLAFLFYLGYGINASRGPPPVMQPSQPANGVAPGASPADKFSAYTPNQRTPEGFAASNVSPLTYLDRSKQSTPRGNSTTPRLY